GKAASSTGRIYGSNLSLINLCALANGEETIYVLLWLKTYPLLTEIGAVRLRSRWDRRAPIRRAMSP
ncbi:hypothetical protein C8D92_11242, partial [Tamilnaduibacter salinus]